MLVSIPGSSSGADQRLLRARGRSLSGLEGGGWTAAGDGGAGAGAGAGTGNVLSAASPGRTCGRCAGGAAE